MSYSTTDLNTLSLKTFLGEYPSIFNKNVAITSAILNSITDGSTLLMPLDTTGTVNAQEVDASLLKVKNGNTALSIQGNSNLDGDASIGGDASIYGHIYSDSSAVLTDVSINGKISIVGISDLDASVLELIADVSSLKASVSSLTTGTNSISASTSRSMLLGSTYGEYDTGEFIDAYSSGMKSYTYPSKLYSESQSKDSSIYINKSDYYDIISGNVYRYYNVDGGYTKINNKYFNKLHADRIGRTTNIIFGSMVDGNAARIVLDKHNYIEVLPEGFSMARIELICTGISNQFGSSWYLLSYSGSVFIKSND